MVRTVLLLTLLIIFAGFSTGLTFEVDVAEITDHSIKDLDYSDEVEVNQEISANVDNVGSIGCTYRFKGEFEQGNDTFERFSAPHSLWSGGDSEIELNYIPMNYTGLVDTTLYVTYCGQEVEVESFEFNVSQSTLPGADVNSRTVEADQSQASIEISSGDLLVPEESPSFWKVGSAEIVNGSATVDYEAPIFSEGETLRYTVLEDGEVTGSVNVKLEEDPTYWEKAQGYKMEGLAAVLLISLLVNLGFLAEMRDIRESLPEIDLDLPDFRKSE